MTRHATVPDEVRLSSGWPGAIETVLQDWMPGDAAGCCCVEASADFTIPAVERALVANAVPRRQAEFIAARWCAHRALAKLGMTAENILPDALGAPAWPPNIIGSITHESGLCAALVTQTSQGQGIGIDLFDRRHKTDMQQISHLVLTPEEIAVSDSTDGSAENRAAFAQLSFSAKEAVVKAVSGTVGRFLDMREIRLSIGAGAFHGTLDGMPWQVSGRWTDVGSFILTLAILRC